VSHADEVITDVNTRRLCARADDEHFALGWDYPGRTLLEVRILRSEQRLAATADDGAAEGQQVVYQDVTGAFRDAGLRSDRPYFYTVFARQAGGEWVRWGEYSLPCTPKSGWREFGRLFKKGVRSRMIPGLLALSCLAAVASVVLVSAPAAEGATQPADKQSAEAIAIAQADPRVAALLAVTDWGGAVVTPWGGTPAAPAGATVTVRWAAARPRVMIGLWPLLTTMSNDHPAPPYSTVDHRLRADDVTALQIDVLLQERRVLQVLPVDGDSHFRLLEQTWPPFSWFPWFTARPWVLAPLFIIIGGIIVARAWQRSRAWNRRSPSMTRHDRQFIGRLSVILFLLAALVWQIYEAIYAASLPAVDPTGFNAGDLAALPMLLIPPALYLAALALELTPMPHRVAWGLVAVVAAATAAYNLATAMTGTATNLNLTYYILLGVLALLAIPRAFSAGRMGWSRDSMPRHA
jgi:hypothetical protein